MPFLHAAFMPIVSCHYAFFAIIAYEHLRYGHDAAADAADVIALSREFIRCADMPPPPRDAGLFRAIMPPLLLMPP